MASPPALGGDKGEVEITVYLTQPLLIQGGELWHFHILNLSTTYIHLLTIKVNVATILLNLAFPFAFIRKHPKVFKLAKIFIETRSRTTNKPLFLSRPS